MVNTGADISAVLKSTVILLVASPHVQTTNTVISNSDSSITQLCSILEATVVHNITQKQAQVVIIPYYTF